MIIVVGGIKGGCGKTTIATNLTVLRSKLDKKKVLLVDTDEQKSASTWALQREERGFITDWTTIHISGAAVRHQIQKMRADYDDIIIDVAGRDTISQRSALTIADIYLIPFLPRSYDIWTISFVSTLIQELHLINEKLKSYAFISQGDSQGKDNEEAIEIIKSTEFITCIPHIIYRRKAYANAATNGLGIIETEIIDKKAEKEMVDLFRYIFP